MPDNPRPKTRERPAITVDVARYEHLLADTDVTDEERAEFLQAMWDIIVAFVDLGFGVHPTQIVQDLCGKDVESITDSADFCADVIPLEDILKDQFESAVEAREGENA